MISDEVMQAIQDLRDVGIVGHGTVSSYGEAQCCPAEGWIRGDCECGADEHNKDVRKTYERVLELLEEEVNIPTWPKKPLDCHGISIPDSMVIIGKSDIQ